KPHLCLADIMLPGKDGLEIVAQLRQLDSRIPVIFLTAKIQPADVVSGFRAGGNDYIRKPFNAEELLVRIAHWINEKHGEHDLSTDKVYQIGTIRFDPKRNVLEGSETTTNLTFKESLLLQLLFTQRNNIIARDYLLHKIWGNDSVYNSRTLDVYINRLRKYLACTPSQIITLKGVGYRMIWE